MENQVATPHSPSAMTPKATRAFVAFGLWLRLGTVGAFGLVAGLLQLVDGEVKQLSGLALKIGGGAKLAIGAVSRSASGQAPRRAPIDAVRRVAGIRPEVSS